MTPPFVDCHEAHDRKPASLVELKTRKLIFGDTRRPSMLPKTNVVSSSLVVRLRCPRSCRTSSRRGGHASGVMHSAHVWGTGSGGGDRPGRGGGGKGRGRRGGSICDFSLMNTRDLSSRHRRCPVSGWGIQHLPGCSATNEL